MFPRATCTLAVIFVTRGCHLGSRLLFWCHVAFICGTILSFWCHLAVIWGTMLSFCCQVVMIWGPCCHFWCRVSTLACQVCKHCKHRSTLCSLEQRFYIGFTQQFSVSSTVLRTDTPIKCGHSAIHVPQPQDHTGGSRTDEMDVWIPRQLAFDDVAVLHLFRAPPARRRVRPDAHLR